MREAAGEFSSVQLPFSFSIPAVCLGFCNEDVTNVANSVCLQDTPISGGSEGDGSEGGGSGDGALDENPLG